MGETLIFGPISVKFRSINSTQFRLWKSCKLLNTPTFYHCRPCQSRWFALPIQMIRILGGVTTPIPPPPQVSPLDMAVLFIQRCNHSMDIIYFLHHVLTVHVKITWQKLVSKAACPKLFKTHFLLDVFLVMTQSLRVRFASFFHLLNPHHVCPFSRQLPTAWLPFTESFFVKLTLFTPVFIFSSLRAPQHHG
jgi:hypothetical protein